MHQVFRYTVQDIMPRVNHIVPPLAVLIEVHKQGFVKCRNPSAQFTCCRLSPKRAKVKLGLKRSLAFFSIKLFFLLYEDSPNRGLELGRRMRKSGK
jgi:hypothetical protein